MLFGWYGIESIESTLVSIDYDVSVKSKLESKDSTNYLKSLESK